MDQASDLILIAPAVLCVVIDTQYVQNIINVMTVGFFLRNDESESQSIEGRYEEFITGERKSHGLLYSLESISNVLITEVVALTPVVLMKINQPSVMQAVNFWLLILGLSFGVLIPYILLLVFAVRTNRNPLKNTGGKNQPL